MVNTAVVKLVKLDLMILGVLFNLNNSMILMRTPPLSMHNCDNQFLIFSFLFLKMSYLCNFKQKHP